MSEYVRKPDWLKIKIGDNDKFKKTKSIINHNCLNTICTSGLCPNHSECWSRGTATFMILGDICTRSCRFCNTKSGKPMPPDPQEPGKIAESIKSMALKHAVLTSVDRDDLDDLGAGHWVNVIEQIRSLNPGITMETLIPDFQGKESLVKMIADVKPEVVSHNIETVRRLTPDVRSAAKYDTSLSVLSMLSAFGIRTKSGFMLGLGETRDEILETMDDLLETGCKVLTLGQYLQPSRKHLPVVSYIHPDIFEEYKIIGIGKGFEIVESGPFVRSSYHAEKHV
jgi:lipoic acid synthetase